MRTQITISSFVGLGILIYVGTLAFGGPSPSDIGDIPTPKLDNANQLVNEFQLLPGESREQALRRVVLSAASRSRFMRENDAPAMVYKLLFEASQLELALLTMGDNDPIIASELARFRSTLLAAPETGLVEVLTSPDIPELARLEFLASLHLISKKEDLQPAWLTVHRREQGKRESQIAQLRTKIQAKIEKMEAGLGESPEESEAMKMLEEYVGLSDLYAQNELVDKAYAILLTAENREDELKLGGSERSVVDYEVGRFMMNVMSSQNAIAAILFSDIVSLENKCNIVRHVTEAVSRGEIERKGMHSK